MENYPACIELKGVVDQGCPANHWNKKQTNKNTTGRTCHLNAVVLLLLFVCVFVPMVCFIPEIVCFIPEILIELDIFAGLTNPSWTVTNETAEFETLKVALTGAKSSTIPLLAGYRGFIVTTTFTDGTIVYRTYGQGGQSSTTLEMALLNSNDGTISSDVIDIAAAGINGLVSFNNFITIKAMHQGIYL